MARATLCQISCTDRRTSGLESFLLSTRSAWRMGFHYSSPAQMALPWRPFPFAAGRCCGILSDCVDTQEISRKFCSLLMRRGKPQVAFLVFWFECRHRYSGKLPIIYHEFRIVCSVQFRASPLLGARTGASTVAMCHVAWAHRFKQRPTSPPRRPVVIV